MAESTRHITIQNGDALPELQQCNKCCSNYHCPFCAASVFKPAKLVKLKTHLQSHFNKAVVCGGYTIHRCGLGCRPALHHHCPYCETTILKRGDFEKHVQVCKKTPPPTSATIPSPTTAALTTPAVRGKPSPTTAVLTTPSPTTAVPTTPAVFSGRVCVRPVIRKRCPVSDISIDELVPTDIEMEHVTPTSMTVPTSTETEMVCNYKCLSASRDCWDCVPTHRQSVMLEWALGTGDQDETIAEVGNVVLKRKDFWTLGLNEQLEATQDDSQNCTWNMDANKKQGYPPTDWWCGLWSLHVDVCSTSCLGSTL
ncbi:uncharacterized protein LOC127956362 isoform X1 [Carassius gibelio]|uniref:uncharacterized protein LOC127956362 isoform X1 n=1 Tax=Carassius gibelio TaxID=101364 RepID=UPI002278ECF1|nr:uncharacterized protein LOC127956362 isoform X1 [Carassius gibelio]